MLCRISACVAIVVVVVVVVVGGGGGIGGGGGGGGIVGSLMFLGLASVLFCLCIFQLLLYATCGTTLKTRSFCL